MISVLLLESKLFPGDALHLSHWDSSLLLPLPGVCRLVSSALTLTRLASDLTHKGLVSIVVYMPCVSVWSVHGSRFALLESGKSLFQTLPDILGELCGRTCS